MEITKQPKKHSALEITLNYSSGFVVAYLTYLLIVMPNLWISESPFVVTTIYTAISVIRSYLWRRAFNSTRVQKFLLK